MVAFLLWLILAAVSLPLAILALLLYPLVWVLTLPFRLVGVSAAAVLEFVRALIRLPVRLLRGAPA